MTLFFNRTFCILIGSLLMGSSFYSQVLNKKISETKLNIAVLDKKKDSLTQLLEQLELANGKLEIKSFSIPELKPNEDLIEHHGMLLVYSEKHEQAKWVAHKISTNIINGNEGRSNDFREDTKVKTGSSTEKDYFLKTKKEGGSFAYDGYGYDRGHLAPSADFRWSKTALSESYFYSNMSPQLPEFNRESWAKLENNLRAYVTSKKVDLFVITGPVLTDDLKKIDRSINKVSIPNYFFKVVLDKKNNKSIGYLIPHKEIQYPLNHYAVSVDSIEQVTQINFFNNLEDSLEIRIEKQTDFSFLNNENNQNNSLPLKANELKKNCFNTIEAKRFIGTNKSVKICGKVVSTHLSKNGHVFINLDQSFPNQLFSITIWKSNTTNFSYSPNEFLKGKTICVKGKVSENKGTPTMSVSNEKSIEIIN